MYIDEWHPMIPDNRTITAGITHVIMAFIDPKNFSTTTDYSPSPVIMQVQDLRHHFDNGTKIGIALGGWGSFSDGFSDVATEQYRAGFSANLAQWMDRQGYDFVDIDWEYPGGNGASQPSNATADIENFPLLLDAIKKALKPGKSVSISVAATPIGMGAFKSAEKTKSTWETVDFVTIMAYDYVNRASKRTGHHTDVEGSKAAVQRYIDLGLPPEKINLGFPFYAKWFQVEDNCHNLTTPDSCEIVPAQDADGADNYKSGVLTFEMKNVQPPPLPASLELTVDATCGVHNNTATTKKCADGYCCSQDGWCGNTTAHCLPLCQTGYGECRGPDAIASFKRARENFKYDEGKGALWYFDETTSPRLFWTWENTDLMSRKFDEIVNSPANKLGGVAAWSLGENSAGWMHVLQMQNMTRLRSSDNQSEGEGMGIGECPRLP
ncbi:glycoside hydrolase superfamily [Xylaria bambusicola]|uniref:glycoside hydrolase superfamily n=1 Tax=Xylaria bambusicola TaxID=326684 RepID=UPI0020075583|nr:glycoside hydrolase superfamily [Xylaria bambusicola]KAI0526237.1 glycoside hydrolase superfamily [Xylaria bambusicola]